MKTKTLTQKKSNATNALNVQSNGLQKALKTTFGIIGVFIMLALCTNTVHAQKKQVAQKEIVVKGNISDEYGPLEGANIALKDTSTGTSTKKDGSFKFPESLKTGDVLVITYLGYKTKEVKVNSNTNVINLVMTNEDITMMGDLNTETPYKSKR